MAHYSITALKTATHRAPGPVFFYQREFDRTVEVNCYFWLLKGEGHVVCVDTGMGTQGDPWWPADSAARAREAFLVGPGEDTAAALGREGVSPEDVDTLILTHLHFDHCGNTPLFRRARIVVSRRGWANFLDPPHPLLAPYPMDVLGYVRDRMGEQLWLAADEEEVLPGIRVMWVGGHTVCSQAVSVDTVKGRVILAGDVVFLYRNLEEDIPVGLQVSLGECLRAMDRFRREADEVLPGHDPEILVRYPGGRVV